MSLGAVFVVGLFADGLWLPATATLVLAFYTQREFGDILKKAKGGYAMKRDARGISGVVDTHGDIIGPVYVSVTAWVIWWLGS